MPKLMTPQGPSQRSNAKLRHFALNHPNANPTPQRPTAKYTLELNPWADHPRHRTHSSQRRGNECVNRDEPGETALPDQRTDRNPRHRLVITPHILPAELNQLTHPQTRVPHQPQAHQIPYPN